MLFRSRGNYIGTDASGTVPLGNVYGVRVEGASTNNLIGGGTAADRNILSGNSAQVRLIAPGNRVSGNYVGTTADGLAVLGTPGFSHIDVNFGDNIIGTNGDGVTDAGEGNLIAQSVTYAAVIVGLSSSGNGTVVAGNRIGVSLDGNSRLG